MFTSSLSFEGLSPANALGASLGRGLVTLSNGGRFGNESTRHIVTTQGFSATVNLEDMVVLLKTLLASTSPLDQAHGGKDSETLGWREMSRPYHRKACIKGACKLGQRG